MNREPFHHIILPLDIQDSIARLGGGGGGGSCALQESILAEELKSQLVLGPADDPDYPVAVLTFEVLPSE